MTEHLGYVKVERFNAIALLEREMGVASGLTNHIHRGALALSYLLYVFNMFLVNQQSHALLTLVGNDFLGRQRLVTDGQFGHIYLTATLFY